MAFQTVLVVDDEPHIIEVVCDYLKQAGYRVVTAGDGQTALTLARHEHPDLVVLDLMLPGGLDGLDVCRSLRQDPGLADVPIIMLTARVEETDKLIGLELGADDYVPSPSAPVNWWPACGRCCAAPRGTAHRQPSSASMSWWLI